MLYKGKKKSFENYKKTNNIKYLKLEYFESKKNYKFQANLLI